ncbi:MAG TPA: flagellin, partial [Sinorhizobium sp.]|nr:flagellin [Sinorhizobium sp.]
LYNSETAAVGVKSVVASFNRSADGSVSVSTLDYDTSTSILVDVEDASRGMLTKAVDADALDPDGTGTPRTYYLVEVGTAPTGADEIALTDATTDAEMDDMIRVVDNLIQQLTDSASTLGAITKRIEMQEGFVANLMDVIDKGVGRLVDADMNEESTRLKALQTQQQLGIQSLSIANTNSENILRLFQQ